MRLENSTSAAETTFVELSSASAERLWLDKRLQYSAGNTVSEISSNESEEMGVMIGLQYARSVVSSNFAFHLSVFSF